MNWKTFLLRFAGLVAFAAMGFALYGITSHLLIMLGLTPDGEGSEGFGIEMTRLAMILYMISIPFGFSGIFIKEDWRWILYLCPLYAPSLFALIHTITHG